MMTQASYSRTAKFLHWAIALALAFQLALGWRLEVMPKGLGLFSAYQLHKSVGITILLLTLIRVAIRFAHPRPALPQGPRWTQILAHTVHGLLYLVMIGAPLTGWAIVSTAKIQVPTLIFGTIPWPHLPLPLGWLEPAENAHGLLAWLGVGLFGLHVAGALRHQFVKGEDLLARMVPFATRSAGLAAGLALVAMFVAHGAGWQWPFAAPVPAVIAEPTGGVSNDIAPIIDNEQVAENAVAPVAPAAPDKGAQNAVEAVVAAKLATTPPAPPEPSPRAPEPVSDWTIAPGGSLRFTASWAGIPVEGRFGSWSGSIRFSPDVLDQTNIRITVDLGSVSTNDSQRDGTIKGADFFNTAVHPQAVFTATKARALGGNRYAVDGQLNLHGVLQPAALTFTLKIDGKTARVSGGTRLDRTRYGVGSGEYASTDQIGGAVSVNFSFVAGR